MKAIICSKYGTPEVLQLQEVEKPTPKANEVLIKIHATTAHIGDTKIRSLGPGLGKVQDFFFRPLMRIMLGFTKPRCKILGMDVSGVIEAVGKEVTHYKKGDEVFASSFEKYRFGAYAEYICLKEDGLLTKKPTCISFQEAAPLANGAVTALLVLRKAQITKAETILIYGASGSLGTYAVQLAKNFGSNVTAVCSEKNISMVQSLGADTVLDYTKDNFAMYLTSYDIVFDAVGKMDASLAKKHLTKDGTYINILKDSSGEKLQADDLQYLAELCESGDLKTVIDRTYKLEEIVEAHRYVDGGHKRGNVVVEVCE